MYECGSYRHDSEGDHEDSNPYGTEMLECEIGWNFHYDIGNIKDCQSDVVLEPMKTEIFL